MTRVFNIAGPCVATDHYMLPAESRCRRLATLVNDRLFFIIHAPRQTGKTTLLLHLVDQLNQTGEYRALYCSLERAQGLTSLDRGIPVIVKALHDAVRFDPAFKGLAFDQPGDEPPDAAIQNGLSRLAKDSDLPLVVLFDEIDCLSGETLIGLLRQLRQGYITRQRIPFVHSLALVGMRNVRDYKAPLRPEMETLGSASPFNIVSEVLTLRNFDRHELAELYAQHGAETGQIFSDEVIDLAYHYTRGQPWLCNALAREMVMKQLNNDFSQPITTDHVEAARESIISRQDTHIDSLLERLREERVRRIVEPIISGRQTDLDFNDDARYVFDLGLLEFRKGDVAPANPIYAELIMRALTFNSEHHLPISLEGKYISGNTIRMTSLLQDFQAFWRENSEIWIERYQYKEAAPHLILQAWLQRIVNGSRIEREYSAGRGRVDLVITRGENRYPIELKIRYTEKTREQGIEQLAGYMDRLNLEEGWLVLFDRRPEQDWDQKIYQDTSHVRDKTIHILGC